MIYRSERDQLAQLIRSYLDDELSAFEFDEALEDFRDSKDSAVKFVASAVWYHYDDCDDHYVVLSKSEWDYF